MCPLFRRTLEIVNPRVNCGEKMFPGRNVRTARSVIPCSEGRDGLAVRPAIELVGPRRENVERFAQHDVAGRNPCSAVEAIYQGGRPLLELFPLAASEVRVRAQLQTANRVNWEMYLKADETSRCADLCSPC